MGLEIQKDDLIQEEEDAQYLENKLFEAKRSIEELESKKKDLEGKITDNVDATNEQVQCSVGLQKQIDTINAFNKSVRASYELQDQALDLARQIDFLSEKHEQLEGNQASNKDKLLYTLGNLKGSQAGGIGFIIKQSLIEKKTAVLKEGLAKLQEKKEVLKGKQKVTLLKIISKEMDTLEQADIDYVVKANESQNEEISVIQEQFNDLEKTYETINKDFLFSQDRLRKTYIQEINIRLRDMQTDIQSTLKVFQRTNEEVTNFLAESDKSVKQLRQENKHREFVAIEMKATQLKDDISKVKTALLVKEAKFEEVKNSCKKDLIHLSLANLFKLIQTILGLDTQINESKKDSTNVSQRSKDLTTLFRDIQKQVHKDLYNTMITELKLRQTQWDTSSKKNQSLISILQSRKVELGEIECQLTREDEELNTIYGKYQSIYNEANSAEESSGSQLRSIYTFLQKLEKQSNRIHKDNLNVTETYNIIDELKQFSQPINQMNQLIQDGTNKGTSIEKSLKDLQTRIKTERIASFEEVQQSAFKYVDKLTRSINRINGILRIVEKNSGFLTDEFNDLEKSKEHISFRQELDQKFKDLNEKTQTKDALKAKLDDIEQLFDLKVRELERNTGQDFKNLQVEDEQILEEIKQQVDDMDVRFTQEASSLKTEIDQLNSKYRYKKAKYQKAQMLKQVKTEQLQDLIEIVEQQLNKIPSIENQLGIIGSRQSQQEQSRLESLQSQIDAAYENNKKLEGILKKQLGIVEEESEPLDELESKVVKTEKIKDIIEILESINISDLEQQTELAQQSVKQVEKGTDTFVTSLRNSKMADTEQANKQIDDVIKSLDLSLREVILLVQDFNDDINETARKKPNLMNKEKLLDQCQRYSNTLQDIQKDRNKMKEKFDEIVEELSQIDVKTANVTEVEQIIAQCQQIETKVRAHLQTTQKIKTELQQTKKEFVENNKYQERRESLLAQTLDLEAQNEKTIESLKSQLEQNLEQAANFELVYQAMLESEDYQPRASFEKKMKRIQQIKQECKRIEEAIKEASEASAQIKKKDPESMTDLNELAKAVKESEKISQKLNIEVKASDVVTKGFEKRRKKLKDAQLKKCVQDRQNELDEAKKKIDHELSIIESLEKSLNDRQSDPNNPDKLSSSDEEEVRRTISELKRELSRVKLLQTDQQRSLTEVAEDINSRDLENENPLHLIANNIKGLQVQKENIRGLMKEVEKVQKQVRAKSTLISTIDCEMRIKGLLTFAQKLDPQIEENRELIAEVSDILGAYQGYTSDAEEEEFHKALIGSGKELNLETDANYNGLKEMQNETKNILQQFNSKKREHDGNLPAPQLEEYQILIGQLEKRYQKYEKRIEGLKESSKKDEEKIANYKLEEKFERRKNEIVEIEDIVKELDTDSKEVMTKIQNEVKQNQQSKFFQAYLEDIYPMYEVLGNALEETEPIEQLVKDLQEELEKKQSNKSTDPKQKIKSHYENIEIKKKITAAMAEAKAIHDKIREIIAEANRRMALKPVRKLKQLYKAVDGDEVDQLFAYWFNKLGIQVPIRRLGGGYYMFGTKKIFCKIINSKLVVRVGGGYMGIEDFILQYGEIEAEKYAQQQEELKNPKEKNKSGFNLIDFTSKFKDKEKDKDEDDDLSPVSKKQPPQTFTNKKTTMDLPNLLPTKSKDEGSK